MPGDELVTVFRSADPDAEEQATVVQLMLARAGIRAEMADDSAPGVPEGAFEIRVPARQEEDARHLVETQRDFTSSPADLSSDLDLVTVFQSQEHNAEMLALEIRSILDAHGIPSVLVGSSALPNLPFEVRVPELLLAEARRAIAAAEEAGPAAAEEAERETEIGGGSGAI